MHRLGYGAWDELKAEIRNHWRFRFDWFFKSRTPQVGEGLGAGLGGDCAGLGLGLGGAAGAAAVVGAARPPDWGGCAAREASCCLESFPSPCPDFPCSPDPHSAHTLHTHRRLQELSRRCETLIRLIEKENEEDEERVAATKKPRGPNKPKGSAAAGGGDSQAPSGAWGGCAGGALPLVWHAAAAAGNEAFMVGRVDVVPLRVACANPAYPTLTQLSPTAAVCVQRAGGGASARPTARECPPLPSAARTPPRPECC